MKDEESRSGTVVPPRVRETDGAARRFRTLLQARQRDAAIPKGSPSSSFILHPSSFPPLTTRARRPG